MIIKTDYNARLTWNMPADGVLYKKDFARKDPKEIIDAYRELANNGAINISVDYWKTTTEHFGLSELLTQC